MQANPIKAAEPCDAAGIRIIRPKKVCEKTDFGPSTLFNLIARGLFPKPFLIIPGGRAKGWLESEVDAWILERKTAAGDRK